MMVMLTILFCFFGSVNNVEDGEVDNFGNIVEGDVGGLPGGAGGDVDDWQYC